MAGIPGRDGYALITGGATRIGATLTRRLAADGWAVAIHCHHSTDAAAQLAADIIAGGGRAAIQAADLADAGAVGQLLRDTDAQLGFCSLLVNNAAAFTYDDVASLGAESMDALYAVNLRAPMLLAREFAARLPDGRKGLIVNLLDQKVDNLNPDFLSYTLMKCALRDATKLLAMGLAPRIRVCGIAPGLTLPSADQTEKGFAEAHADAPLGHGSTPDDLAEGLLYLTRAAAMTGTILTIDGGQHLVASARDVMFKFERGGD